MEEVGAFGWVEAVDQGSDAVDEGVDGSCRVLSRQGFELGERHAAIKRPQHPIPQVLRVTLSPLANPSPPSLTAPMIHTISRKAIPPPIPPKLRLL